MFYVDDVIVLLPHFNSHEEHLEKVLQQFQKAGLELKPSKYEVFQREVRYLGHVVSEHGVSTDPENVAVVKEVD